jgi:hypothetical protein
MTQNRPSLYTITEFETNSSSLYVLFTGIKKPALTGRDMSFTGDRERG